MVLKFYILICCPLAVNWRANAIIGVTKLNQIIEGLLLKHQLRGFDVIHLASALLMHKDSHLATRFACFDHALNKAAEEEGLDVPIC